MAATTAGPSRRSSVGCPTTHRQTTPAPTRPAPAQQSTVPGPPPPPAPPEKESVTDGLKRLVQDAKKKYVQTVGIILQTRDEAAINAACDFIAKQWALAEKNPLRFKDGRTEVTTSDLSENQLDALTAHVVAHDKYWNDAWRESGPQMKIQELVAHAQKALRRGRGRRRRTQRRA